ncbi:DUF2589 domain-containing protein [Chryseotalea sanaruensis]|uniref:DUF2589 domain-containing protein n=1 Tax=Chryseotalea sanaruensis TaxID=2482724 RepID=A0A401U979_9BACT|nr:DUF2589 domain-containing protein [Chryseotalea sanaruensis]GCC51437.1 DUF2589 domain-containing protein [Chryseotalea sanaruensis]
MAKKENYKYEFAGLPIYDIIGKPLIAIARAQNMMSKEQLRTMLDACFKYHNGAYEPIMLKMVVTRSFLEPATKPGKGPELKMISTDFFLPMITIFPINALGIENVDIDFNVEITSQYMVDKDEIDEGGDKISAQPSSLECLGKITKGPGASGEDQEQSYENNSSFRIAVEAGTMPLTKGLLEIINIYTNAIQPIDTSQKNHQTL